MAPKDVRIATAIPAIEDPAIAAKTLFLNFNPSKDAARHPVQTPVPGKGTLMKKANPKYPYFSMVEDLFIPLL
jgi:hypothetical protein